jgi:hypothetical protein
MATKSFTEKQKEIVARKMGYQGPMEGFDKFLRSDPALERKYGIITEKFMARGGVVSKANKSEATTKKKLKMQEGGAVPAEGTATTTSTPAPVPVATAPVTTTVWGPDGTMYPSAAAAEAAGVSSYSTTPVAVTVTPQTATASTVDPNVGKIGPAQTATAQTATAQTVAAPTPVTAASYTAEQAQGKVEASLAGLQAEQGEVKPEALVEAQTIDPRGSIVMGMEAEQARPDEFVQAQAPTRLLQEDELVAGTTVDWDKIDEQLGKIQAEQGVVTAEMTVQGQLDKMMADFQANNPPAWAANAVRGATAEMARRGLGASSLAGQAILQAAIEAATPIAAANAAVYERMGLQNLSNRQQVAMVRGEMRAQFLGQEFDQAFQTRVLNAAKISDVANQNFSAQVQVALENARLTQSVNIANLNNRQAMVMAKAAALSSLETQNLSNMQQAAVANARAFLDMEMANLNARQQTAMFKAQEISQAILSDTAATNAARQFNAASKQQADQFNSSLASEVARFNASQVNAMNQFNAQQVNAVSQFNAEQQNANARFSAQNATAIAQANAQMLTQVSVSNTAAVNAANIANAQMANAMSTTVYNSEVQLYRDAVDYAFKAGESDLERENRLAIESMRIEASKYAADKTVDAAMYSALGTLSASVFGKGGDGISLVKGAVSSVTKAVADTVKNVFTGTKSTTKATNQLEANGFSFIDYAGTGQTSLVKGQWNYIEGSADIWGEKQYVAISPDGDLWKTRDGKDWVLDWTPNIGSAETATRLWEQYGLN